MAKQIKSATVPAAAEIIKLDENRVDYFPLSMFTVKEGYNLRMFDSASDADDKLVPRANHRGRARQYSARLPRG
jgi:hypothetical protein